MARWQRERRQQAIVVTIFTSVLIFVLGLVAWAASERYYDENLTPAATIQGRIIPKRDYQRQLAFELVRFYQEFGVPPGFENDPQLAGEKARYEDIALEHVVEQRVLELAARDAGFAPAQAQIDEQYGVEFGQYKVRHILIDVPADAEDRELADLNAQAKARAIAAELKASPNDQELWNRLAQAHSADPGSKFSGGELGFGSTGQYVEEFENAIRTNAIGQVSDPVKTQFGYHVLQVTEYREPASNEVVQRYLTSGFGVEDLKARARAEVLRKEFERRAKASAVASPTEQAHVAKIVVNIPLPTVSSFDQFTEALQKQTTVRQELEKGTDFAEIAKQHSDDVETKEKGGDMGWVARGMIVDPRAEDAIFSTEPGKTAEPVSAGQQWTVYRVLEKDPARELESAQKDQIAQRAYQYWLQRQKKAFGVQKHILGLSLD
jgi:parvulin-like peptidyl-prolyl isomerase